MAQWAELLRRGRKANVHAKISGLNTVLRLERLAARPTCSEAVAVAVDAFGADRLVCGSDWPVALLNGDYAKVWHETASPCDRGSRRDADTGRHAGSSTASATTAACTSTRRDHPETAG